MKQNIFIAILLFVLLSFQIAFLNNFNLFILNFNCVIIALILMLHILPFNKVIVIAIICGFITDIFSGMPFGTFLLTYGLTFFIAEALSLNFFTNNSLYSLIILGVITVALFNFIFLGVSGIFYFLNMGDFAVSAKYWINFLWQILDNSIVLVICFYFINNRSRLFKPVFLRK